MGTSDDGMVTDVTQRSTERAGGRRRALLLENIHPDAASVLEAAGFAVETMGRAMDEAELCERLPGFDVVGIRSRTHVTQAVLQAAPDLLAIGAFCIGTNQIDLGAATRGGVAERAFQCLFGTEAA